MRLHRLLASMLIAVLQWSAAGCDRSAPPAEAAPLPVKAVAAAPRPDGPLPPGASCVTDACHASYRQARQVHQPVAQDACGVCHGPDIGGHQFPLIRQGNQSCTFCHSVAGTLAHQHEPVAGAGCVSCHDPHASASKYLLRTLSVEQLCLQCHEMATESFVHAPLAEGGCMTCHTPHQSQAKGLLRGAGGRDHCLGCHTQIEARLASGRVHEPAAGQCVTCHNPHTSSRPSLLKAPPRQLCTSCHDSFAEDLASLPQPHGAIDTASSCSSCHDPHAGDAVALLRGREDRLCLTCHDSALTAGDGRTIMAMGPTLERRFLHGPIRAGECSPCHAPHGGEHDALLRQPFPARFYQSFALDNYALCFQCHNADLVTTQRTASVTDFRQGEVNLHFVHVNQAAKGRTCKTCHDLHGSDLPNHMADAVPFEGSGWAMPIGYQKQSDGGTCSPGCHEPKTYQRDTRGAS